MISYPTPKAPPGARAPFDPVQPDSVIAQDPAHV